MPDTPPGTFDPSFSLGAAAFRSWRSMKGWVMTWLWYLNILSWTAIFFLPRAEAQWALIAYAAIGPFIGVMIVAQRGLTRLAGLIHLPWVPFTAYLGLRLYSDLLGSRIAPGSDPVFAIWAQMAFWSLLLCLALDSFDIWRWLRGERYVLGTAAAAAAGASRDLSWLEKAS